MTNLVKILLNGKLTFVYPEEASVLIAKGLAVKEGDKAIEPDCQNKMIATPPQNKAKKIKNASNKNNN